MQIQVPQRLPPGELCPACHYHLPKAPGNHLQTSIMIEIALRFSGLQQLCTLLQLQCLQIYLASLLSCRVTTARSVPLKLLSAPFPAHAAAWRIASSATACSRKCCVLAACSVVKISDCFMSQSERISRGCTQNVRKMRMSWSG